MKLLSGVGTAAMIWVGGGIIVHGLEQFGAPRVGHAIGHAFDAAAHGVPGLNAFTGWLVTAVGSGLVGLLVGAAMIPLAECVFAPRLENRGSVSVRVAASKMFLTRAYASAEVPKFDLGALF